MKDLANIILILAALLSVLLVLALASGERVYLDRPEFRLKCAHCGIESLDIFGHMDVCKAHDKGNECKRCKK